MAARVESILKKVIILIYFLVLTVIIGLNIFESRGYHATEMVMPRFFNILTLVFSLFLILVVIKFREGLLTFIHSIKKEYILIPFFIGSAAVQLLVVKWFDITPSWDFGTIVHDAAIIFEGQTLNDYFIKYPNNIFLVILLGAVGKLFSPTLFIFQLFNICVITLSQYLIYSITKKLASYGTALASLLLSGLFFPYIFFAPIVYTDTISLLFLLLPLTILIDQNGRFIIKLTRVLPASILFALGMILKGSLVIFVIAFAIVLFIFGSKWKKSYSLIPILILLILKVAFNSWIYQNDFIDKAKIDRYSFPVTHWLVMGQNSERFGKYAANDVAWTAELLNKMPKETVSQIHLKELIARIKEKGVMGNIAYTKEKISHTWTDGTYYSLNKIKRRPIHPENIASLLNYKSGHIIQAYARIQHLFVMAGILLFSLKVRKEKSETYLFFLLSIIGFFLFFIMWEARSRYLVSLTPIFIMMASIGYFGLSKTKSQFNKGIS
ncbi:hypothetical protein A8F94_10910 [Bacillus sp. FJAT-27225]|uniref:hypothetical protein n=1 Tax=Bacillus sp. FJAT-27225 TaxID=1743144 RepID=UPI00080C246E|nr:hypothetical protein [Bacillus sp. FJAT-27225]OCA88298.1 hypothetical protein A8F94_10910 [Bacillus sp. FJAT-27225]